MTPRAARRIALAAQGFTRQSRDAKVGWPKLSKAIDAMHLLQIDSVNVLTRSHYLPLFSRLGAYDKSLLDKHTLAKTNRKVFECWAHEASLVPLHLHPLMRWRMNRARNGDGNYGAFDGFAKTEKAYLSKTIDFIAKNGPTTASKIPGAGKSAGGWWGWSKGKLAVETLFDHGLITTSHRHGFERIYDITERVIPADILDLPTPDEEEGFERLMLMATEALGIGTEIDLRDYFRLPVADARKALHALLASKQLEHVEVQGWSKSAYMLPNTQRPRKVGGTALLSPFDPLVWNRDRASRLFNFHYRIEIYTPQHKRKFGYYVLPFLFGEDLAGRFCLKADRENAILRVNTSHHDDKHSTSELAKAAAEELRRMAGWLGLKEVEVVKQGNLASALTKHF